MKTLKLTLAASLLALTTAIPAALACPPKKDGNADAPKKEAPKRVAQATFRVEGMHCDGCADKVKSTLAKTAGIVKVEVKVADKRVMVSYDADKLTVEKIAKLIAELGYKAAAEA